MKALNHFFTMSDDEFRRWVAKLIFVVWSTVALVEIIVALKLTR